MYLFQDQKNIGNISVRLMCIFDLLPCVTVNIMLVHLADYCNFVDAMTCLVCYTFLSCAEIDSMRCIFSFLTVTFGQVMKNPCLISAIEVYFVGLKMFSRQKFISSGFFFITNRLLHIGLFFYFGLFYFYLEGSSLVVYPTWVFRGFCFPV